MLEALLEKTLELESQMGNMDSWFNTHLPDSPMDGGPPRSPQNAYIGGIDNDIFDNNEPPELHLPRVGSAVMREQELEQIVHQHVECLSCVRALSLSFLTVQSRRNIVFRSVHFVYRYVVALFQIILFYTNVCLLYV